MASTASRPQAELPSATGFSYAQAAKGRTPSIPGSTSQSGEPSGSSTPNDAAANGQPTTNGVGSHELGRTLNGVTFRGSSFSKESESQTTAQTSAPPSPKAASAATISKEDESAAAQSSSTEKAWDKASQTSNDKNNDAAEKPRRSKKSKGADKSADKETEKDEKEAKPQEVLVAAPLPSVNIWHQRKEAFTAKQPATPAAKPASSTLTPNGVANSPKSTDVRKKEDASLSPAASKDVKSSKKSADGSRAKEDGRRSAPRGSREKESLNGSQLPPPVEDVISWPTPENVAAEEEKKKAQSQEKAENQVQDDGSRGKRTKEKWVPVPYTPTVTFNTPIPTRGGGRGRGGSRAGRDAGRSHTSNSPSNGDKAAATSNESRERARENFASPRAGSLPARREGSSDGKTGSVNGSDAASAQSAATSEESRTTKAASKPAKPESVNGSTESNGRRAEQGTGASDSSSGAKDAQANRERGESRSERGRGGFRGRGGHSSNFSGSHNGHAFTNGHNGQTANGGPVRQGSNGPFSPVQQQPHFGNSFARGGRGNGRSQPAPNNMYGRYTNGTVQQQMPPLQTGGMVDYQGMHPMSAMPYTPFVEQYSVLGLVQMQLDYYFSIDNLCKDVFLRKHMDSQGFVLLGFIANFKRIRALTDDFELLRFACHGSELIDIIQGEDGADRVRRRESWEKWVFPMEERDVSARNDGPKFQNRIVPHPRAQSMGAQVPMSAHPGMSPPPFSPNGNDASFRAYSVPNPYMNGPNGVYQTETPLSAAVPDFAPGSAVNGSAGEKNAFVEGLGSETAEAKQVNGVSHHEQTTSE